MNTISKALIGSVAAGAMAISAVTPAFAQRHQNGGVDAGDIIAGAIVLGGIAAVASSAGRNDRYGSDYGYDRAGYGDRHNRDYDRNGYGRDNPRRAIERCVRAAEAQASGHSYGRADVTDVRNVRETRYGYEVRGRIAVNNAGRGWQRGDGDYGRGWGGDYRGWNSSMRGYDSGSFQCKFERGQIVHLDIDGIRGR